MNIKTWIELPVVLCLEEDEIKGAYFFDEKTDRPVMALEAIKEAISEAYLQKLIKEKNEEMADEHWSSILWDEAAND